MAPPDRPADTQIGLILPQWSIIIVCAFAGLAGSLVDSVLGATLQYSGKRFLGDRGGWDMAMGLGRQPQATPFDVLSAHITHHFQVTIPRRDA